ncbi:MAG: hypothetical protein JWN04_5537 [Myxococcaceae bacterium]|nr:hypothetical protein [Myxococcaceae bacterium]
MNPIFSSKLRSPRPRRAAREKREGAALLIVLFILMMATGTAVYAMQATQFEQRAAGSLQQAMRTKYIAEAATVSVLALCLELGTTGCVDLKHGDFSTNERQKYALPDRGTTETITTITTTDFAGSTWLAPLLPSDALIVDTATNSSGSASPFVPNFITSIEEWRIPSAGETRPRFRLLVSTYGLLNLGGQISATPAGLDVDNTSASDFRDAHESVSATRAFFDVR